MPNYRCNGHIPDPQNKIYIPFNKSQISATATPSTFSDVDLRPFSPPQYRHDQGQTESCVGNSVTKALELRFAETHGIENYTPLSRLSLYYGARDEMDPKTTHIDNGTNISLAMDVLRRFGVCREETWPFLPEKINIPSPIMADRESFLNKINGHFKIDSTGDQRIHDIILNLQNKNPVVCGVKCGDEMFNYNSTSSPISSATNIKGGHAICLMGYIGGKIMFENSWGLNFGQNGFGFFEPSFIANNSLTSDCWVMQTNFDLFWENK